MRIKGIIDEKHWTVPTTHMGLCHMLKEPNEFSAIEMRHDTALAELSMDIVHIICGLAKRVPKAGRSSLSCSQGRPYGVGRIQIH